MKDKKNFKLVHQSEIQVRWGDMDAFNHVNNAAYLSYFEQARCDWWNSMGMDTRRSDEGPVVLLADCFYKKAVYFPSTLVIDLYASAPGRSSFTIFYECRVKGSDEICTTGSTKMVWVHYAIEKSIELPDIIRQALPSTES